MSFESMLYEDSNTSQFGSAPYVKNFKERQNVSKVDLDSDRGCTYLKVGDWYSGKYDPMGVHYVACMDLSYGLFFSIFDVNCAAALAVRMYRFDTSLPQRVAAWKSRLRAPNLEARIIGVQTDESKSNLERLLLFVRSQGLRVIEAELFGDQVRHVAMDTKRGMTFDVLALNRPYKPGELKCTTTVEQYEREFAATLPAAPESKQKGSKTRGATYTERATGLKSS